MQRHLKRGVTSMSIETSQATPHRSSSFFFFVIFFLYICHLGFGQRLWDHEQNSCPRFFVFEIELLYVSALVPVAKRRFLIEAGTLPSSCNAFVLLLNLSMGSTSTCPGSIGNVASSFSQLRETLNPSFCLRLCIFCCNSWNRLFNSLYLSNSRISS
jgi:hypothetical protein